MVVVVLMEEVVKYTGCPALSCSAGQKVDHLKTNVLLGGCILHQDIGVK